MAKAQKRGNREIKKPKVKKAPLAQQPAQALSKGALTPVSLPRKKI